jgi:hypothetical protein
MQMQPFKTAHEENVGGAIFVVGGVIPLSWFVVSRNIAQRKTAGKILHLMVQRIQWMKNRRKFECLTGS